MTLNIHDPANVHEQFVQLFAAKSLIPIVGSGISCGLEARNGRVPNGTQYKKHMLQCLTDCGHFSAEELDELGKRSFSSLCDVYEDDDHVPASTRFAYMKNHFYQVRYEEEDSRRRFFDIDWPYIYTLNIDDAIEGNSSYKKIILPRSGIDVRAQVFNEERCVIKLHGDIGDILIYHTSEKVFTAREYALSITDHAPIYGRLKNDRLHQNIVYIGCSLDDEFDLLAISHLPCEDEKDTTSRSYIFTLGCPSTLQQTDYKKFGITDIVCFKSYDAMYEFLYSTWRESTLIRQKDIAGYRTPGIQNIPNTDRDANYAYFFWGKNLIDPAGIDIHYPAYFIKRSLTDQIVRDMDKSHIQIITGRHLSGKTYLLADLYRTIRDRTVYIFNGISKLSTPALDSLLSVTGSVFLLDTGAIDRAQLAHILERKKNIHDNKNNLVIVIRQDDQPVFGLLHDERGKLLSEIILYTVPNRFADSKTVKELSDINRRLPYAHLPIIHSKHTIVDHLIFAEDELSAKGRFLKIRLTIDSHIQLAFLIMLAVKESTTTLDLVSFNLEAAAVDLSRKYEQFIERIPTGLYERDASDPSGVKYVLNSKYWLRRELGQFAQQEKNHGMIADAYRHLIDCIRRLSPHDEHRQRRMYRAYIMFDVMNEIFFNRTQGNLKLMVTIYTHLHKRLAEDFNFIHQEAKCYLNFAYYTKSNGTEKETRLRTAHDLVVIAESMAQSSYERAASDTLYRALSHIQYTHATVLCEWCNVQKFADPDTIRKAIDAISVAFLPVCNQEDIRRDKSSSHAHGIARFMKNYDRVMHSSLPTDYKKKFQQAFNDMRNM